MNDKPSESLMKFPCTFTFKIICKKTPEVKQQLIETLGNFFDKVTEKDITRKDSKNKNYCSYSITVSAQDKKTVDSAYSMLNENENVLILF